MKYYVRNRIIEKQWHTTEKMNDFQWFVLMIYSGNKRIPRGIKNDFLQKVNY